jgi:D-glycero-D-manno-heptose 1,7-bisphosphate phosphatase
VINRDSENFIKSPDEWIPLPGSLEAIGRLTRAGYGVVVATNQSGLGRGLFDLSTLAAIHAKLFRLAGRAGGRIQGVFFCPHHPDAGCQCRKPRPGLLLDAAARFGIPLASTLAVGDSLRDIEAAENAGARPVLVLTGNGAATLERHRDRLHGLPVYPSLSAAVEHWLPQRRSASAISPTAHLD